MTWEVKHEMKTHYISRDVANAIADALGTSKNTTRIILDMDWRLNGVHRLTVEQILTDEQGRPVAQYLEDNPPVLHDEPPDSKRLTT